jgi:SAM-dependent methyltransferase
MDADAAYWQGWIDAWTYMQSLQTTGNAEAAQPALSATAATLTKEQWLAVYQQLADYDAALDSAPAGVRLNLGSGEIVLRDFINVDLFPHPGTVHADLTKRWPWDDDSVDYVRASHIIEHLPDKIFTMNELWRVLKPGGRSHISVPTTEGAGAWQDPTHVSFWNRRSFLYFEDGGTYHAAYAKSYGIQARFSVLRERIDQTLDGPILEITLVAVKA